MEKTDAKLEKTCKNHANYGYYFKMLYKTKKLV